jgi:FlaA1/EpsC-like NDP-sugar epimerase
MMARLVPPDTVKKLLQRNEHLQPCANEAAVRATDRFLLKIGDLALVWLGLLLAVLIRTDFNWTRTLNYLEQQTWFFVTLSISIVLAFWQRGLYRRDWRYVGISDALDIAITMFVVMFPFEMLTLTARGVAFPRTGLIIAYFPILFFIAGLRMLIRIVLERRGRKGDTLRYLVVGEGDAAEVAVRELQRAGGQAVGLVTLEPSPGTLSIRGCPHCGHLAELKELVGKHNVDGLILAGLEPAQNTRVVNEAADLATLKLRTVPAVSGLLKGDVEVNTIRALRLEDLLEREPVEFEREKVGQYLSGQTVLVTGAGGSIGSEIIRQIVPLKPEKVLLLGRGENSIHEILMELKQTLTSSVEEGPTVDLIPIIADVRNPLSMRMVFQEHKPDVVFHAAAHKHVPLMEAQPVEACSNNIFGTINLMDQCREHEVSRLVVLSTDKAVDPSSVMGATKRVTELLVHTSGQNGFTAVRFGNVLGSRGSVVPTLSKQIERGGPVTITSPEMSRYFMTIPEAVSLVLGAGATAVGGEIYVLEMGQPVKIVALAENLIRLFGLTPHKDIELVYTGARPGEKLHEELVYSGESSTPSGLRGIVKVAPKALSEDWPGENLEALKRAVETGKQEEARRLLFALLD